MISTMKENKRKLWIVPAVLLFWLGVWAAASLRVNQELLIPSPWAVARHLYDIVLGPDFLKIIPDGQRDTS